MKALITAPFHEEGLNLLKKYMDIQYENWKETKKIYSDSSEFIEKIKKDGIDVLIVESDFVDEDVINSCNLKIIGSCRATPYNVDVEAATQKGIPVFFTPGRNADAVADLTVALIFAQLRRLTEIDRLLKSGKFFVEIEEDLANLYSRFGGLELKGKNIGIVGLGRIGYGVAKRLRFGFGVNILVYDPYVPDERIKKVEGKRVELKTLLKESDVVTLHVSATPEAEKLIGAEEIALMKPTAYFINTSKALATDEDALYEALKNKKIAGAGLDVFNVEPVDSDNRFLKLDNVTVTPHIAGQTVDVVRHQSIMIAESIAGWLEKKEPKYLKNPEILKK